MASRPSTLSPLWHQTAPAVSERAPVGFSHSQDEPGDVIVIGAGVTGLSTALHLAERGAKVTVLERAGPGLGTTGMSNGQIIAGLQKPPEALLAAYGEAQGERLIEFSGKAPDVVFDLIHRHAIDCDAERSGWIQSSRSSRGLDALQEIANSWAQRGAPTRMLDRNETARLLGTQVYAGSWHDARNGTINPFAYARGLAVAAQRSGTIIHRQLNVVNIERKGDAWLISTDQGAIIAPTVVIATNAFTSQLEGVAKTFLGRTYLSAHSVQIASEPLSAGQLQSLLPERSSCGDTSHLRLRYFRLDRMNRFVIGGPGWLTPPHSPSAISFRLLEASARRMFPQLATTRFEHYWAARDTVTPDLLPHLYEPEPGLFSAIGFNGRGLAIGSALGRVLAARALGESAEAQPFPTTPASAVPLNLPSAVAFYFKVALARLRAGAK